MADDGFEVTVTVTVESTVTMTGCASCGARARANDRRWASPRDAPSGDRTFRRYDPAQSFLMPPSLDDWSPDDHTARFVAEAVDELLDLTAVYASSVAASGAPPYDPTMMLELLVYGDDLLVEAHPSGSGPSPR